MSNQLAIATVTAAVERLLNGPLGAELAGATAVAARPRDSNDDLDSDPGISVFLYGIGPRTAYTPHAEDLPTRRSNGELTQRPRTTLELTYLLIAYGEPSRHVPERMLAVAARELHAHPFIDRDLIADIRGAANPPGPEAPVHPHLALTDLDDEIELVKFSPIPLDLGEMSSLWSALQAPYAASLSFRASVVSIDAEVTGQPALPVLAGALYTRPLRSPVIDQVVSAAGDNEPIVALSTILVRGSNLRSDVTLLRLGGADLAPNSTTNVAITLALPDAPAGSLRSGLQTAQVVQQILMGEPAVPHEGITSNQVTFLLHPSLATAVVENLVVDGSSRSGEVVVTVDLTIEADQSVVLRLSDPVDESILHRVASPPRAAEAATVTIPFAGVQAGSYLVQVEIDGAESQLDRDAGDAATGPLLVLA